jgi:hypothetical protein
MGSESDSDSDENGALLRPSGGRRSGGGIVVIPTEKRSGGRRPLWCKLALGLVGLVVVAALSAFYFEQTTRNLIYVIVGGRRVSAERKAWVDGTMAPHFEQFMSKDDRILDFGTGSGMTSEIFTDKGYGNGPLGDLHSLDFGNRGFYGNLSRFVDYDGMHLPFAQGSKDATISLSVMHHIPEEVLASLIRQLSHITERLLVVEDCWDTIQKNGKPLGKGTLDFWDSFSNFEWSHHPHTTKALPGWIEFYNANGFDVMHTQRHKASEWGHTFIALKSKVWKSNREAVQKKKRSYTCPTNALVTASGDRKQRFEMWEDPSCTQCRLYGDGSAFPRCVRTRQAVADGEPAWSALSPAQRPATGIHGWWWNAVNRRLRRRRRR